MSCKRTKPRQYALKFQTARVKLTNLLYGAQHIPSHEAVVLKLIRLLRLFVLLSGLAHVTLPDGSDGVWVVEGVNGLIVAADTTGVGHHTAYPSDKETVALQIPFADGKVPAHKILKQGACHSASQVISHGSLTPFLGDEL
jgi:hypothetical protein